MVWIPGKTAFSYSRLRGAVSVAGNPVGGISNVADVNAMTNSVVEGAANGTTVGITAFATDPTPGDTITYSLTDDAGGRFTIGSSTGVITVADGSLLVFATNQSHNITVRATSTDTSTSDQTFTINVTEATPSFGSEEWLGIWEGTSAQGVSFETWLGKEVKFWHEKIYMGGNGFTQANSTIVPTLQDYNADHPEAIMALIFDLYPTNIGTGPEFSAILAGTYDTQLDALADAFISAGQDDAHLRLWHEMDISSKSYSPRQTGQQTIFRDAWAYVHGRFNARPGANFTWQYSINGPAGDPSGLTQGGELLIDYCYPGDDYVDEVGVGSYDRGQYGECNNPGHSINKLNYVRDFAISHNKKFCCPEWGLWSTNPAEGSTPGCGDDQGFIQLTYDYFNQLPSSGPGALSYLLYFNQHVDVELSQYPVSEGLFKSLFGA